MEFTTEEELYLTLLPAFKVKARLNSITKYPNIENKHIWKYLRETKWRHSYNLTISEVVNDIITVDLEEIHKFIGGTK